MVRSAIIAAGLLLAAGARGGGPGTEFSRANEYYARGDFRQALEIYLGLAGRGWESAGLYYNLGNAYYRLGQTGRAIANYRRAWRLSPRDPEINFNLSHARRLSRDDLPERPAGTIGRAQHFLASLLPLTAWKNTAAVLYFLVVAAAAVWAAVGTWRKTALTVLKYLLAILLPVLAATALVFHYHSRERGVIVVSELPVRYGPDQEDITAFNLHEGTEARIIRRREDWSQILLADGKTGWVPTAALEIIPPLGL